MPGSTAIIFPSEDGYKDLFSDEVCEYCNFFVLPVSYSIDSVTFYDGLNTDNRIFFNHNFSPEDFNYAGIPPSVFTSQLEEAETRGFSSAVILTPSRRIGAIYDNAASAIKKYRRRKSVLNGNFAVNIIDTKSFSFGVGMSAVKCSQYINIGCWAENLLSYAKELSDNAVTLIYRTDLSSSHSFLNGSIYDFSAGKTACIRISGNRILPLSIKPDDNSSLNKYIGACVRAIKPRSCYGVAANDSIRADFISELSAATGKTPVLSAPLSVTDEYCFSPYSIIVSIL